MAEQAERVCGRTLEYFGGDSFLKSFWRSGAGQMQTEGSVADEESGRKLNIVEGGGGGWCKTMLIFFS